MNQCQPSWRRNYFLSGDLVIAILFVSISDLKGQRGKLLKERLARFFLIIWTRVIAVWFQLLAVDELRRLMGIRDQYHLSLLLPPYHPSQRKKNSFRTLWKTQWKIPYEDSILFCLLLFGLGSNLVARVDLHWLTSHTKSVYTDKLTLNISLLYRYLISQVIIYYTNSVQMHLISSLEEIQLEYDKRYSLLFLSFTWDALETEEVKKFYWNLLGFWTMT